MPQEQDIHTVVLCLPNKKEELFYSGGSDKWSRFVFDAMVDAMTISEARVRNHILRRCCNGVEAEAFVPCKS